MTASRTEPSASKGAPRLNVHLINPSSVSFGTAVITPRWQYVLAAATPRSFGDPILVDETLAQVDPESIHKGDVVGIGIHTANALRGYEVGNIARERGAFVVFGGIHATLFPEEAMELGGAHAVVKGDGDLVWQSVLADCRRGYARPAVRWRTDRSQRFCSGALGSGAAQPLHVGVGADGARMSQALFVLFGLADRRAAPRQRASDVVIEEIVQLRRLGFRFIALADDNFYPVTLTDIELAEQQKNAQRVSELKAIRAERFELMSRLAQLPDDMVFFTQITMEAAEDLEFLDAMKAARIKGALVGVESVTPEGLKDVYKDFNLAGDKLAERLKTFRQPGRARAGIVHFRVAQRSSGDV